MHPISVEGSEEQHGIGEAAFCRSGEPALGLSVEVLLGAELFPNREQLGFRVAFVRGAMQTRKGLCLRLGHELTVVFEAREEHLGVQVVPGDGLAQEGDAGASVFFPEVAAEVKLGQIDHGLRRALGHGKKELIHGGV